MQSAHAVTVGSVAGWLTMPGPVRELLERDHVRLDDLLNRADAAAPAIDLQAYEAFRAGLLRHIAMEEKVLLPEARRLRGGESLAAAKQLRADHAALASLLVPTPTKLILVRIRNVLVEHNPLEEGPAGVYQLCEDLAGAQADALLARILATPEVPLAPHFDGPRAMQNVERLLHARRRERAK
jgi:hypothetical protein